MTSAETQTGANRRAIPADAVEGRWALSDGHALRRIDWPGAVPVRGSLLFLPGRGDCYEKYLETLAYWAARSWRTTAVDWRGQAGSGRLGTDAVTGHVADFALWVNDLAHLWDEWRVATPAPHVIVGHSMGGHLALRALAEDKVDPKALVLSAPMLGIAGPPVPPWLLHLAARVMATVGDARRPAWKWSEKPGQMPAERVNLLTHDLARYSDELWWRDNRPDLVMGPASWGWTERAFASMRGLMKDGVLERIATPTLLIGVEHDRLVSFRAIKEAARRLPGGELVSFGPEARHEVLRESDPVRDRALAAIDEFLDRCAPAEHPA